MIKTKTVIVDVGGRYQKYYESLGYTILKIKDERGRTRTPKGTKIEISVFDLPRTSSVLIEYECDGCKTSHTILAGTMFGRNNSQYLKTGETFCSNCANHRMSGENNAQYVHGNSRFCEYRYNAGRRGIIFELSVIEFEELISQPCHYCGGYSADYVENSRGNGIDRINNNIGYKFNNCLPCCSKCNFTKNTMPYNDFIAYIKKIYERLIKNEI